MSRPLSLIVYTCGHQSPVRGAGAVVDRPCEACRPPTEEGARQLPEIFWPPVSPCTDCGHIHEVESGECNTDSAVCNCEWFQP